MSNISMTVSSHNSSEDLPEYQAELEKIDLDEKSDLPPPLPPRRKMPPFKMYVGIMPIYKPSKLAESIGYFDKDLFADNRNFHLYCIIEWENSFTKYEVDLNDDKRGKNSKTLISTVGGFENSYHFMDDYIQKNPRNRLMFIGETMKSPKDASGFCIKWSQDHSNNTPMWENSRLFVDEFLETIADTNPTWKTKVKLTSTSDSVIPENSYGFSSALEYIDWKFKKTQLLLENTKGFNARVENDRLMVEFTKTTTLESSRTSPTSSLRDEEIHSHPAPCLNIVIQIVGSRGDVQPFVALGIELQKYGHRVRLATHETFRTFVTENGLEFYPLFGDPALLMAYMVKNPGLIPGFDAIKQGEIQKKRDMIAGILESTWKSCTEPDEVTGLPFEAQAIIANPPSFGHIHCAEKLMIPLHIYFTMPWSPTVEFPHPLVNVDYSGGHSGSYNKMSYDVTETMTWSGLGDIINNFRKKTLGLHGIPITHAPRLLHELKVPHTYCWSPNLIPKPKDWGSHIDVCGFFFLDLASNYTPPDDLVQFLNAGPPPVYIGFGSIVVDDPDKLTKLIFSAVEKAGVRAIVSKGWGGLGTDNVPSNIYMIGNCPHDWLFTKVSAVCHHGGAGTTAAGLLKGKPTIVVPFFGDQPFWGAMIARMRVGPEPIHNKKLTADNLAEALKFATSEEITKNAEKLGIEMNKECGVKAGVKSFHKQLPILDMVCDFLPGQLAIYYIKNAGIKVCEIAASVLLESGKIKKKDLSSYKCKHWDIQAAPEDIVDSAMSGGYSLTVESIKGVTGFVKHTKRGIERARRAKSKTQATKEISKGMAKAVGSSVYHPLKGTWEVVGAIGDGFKHANAMVDSKEHFEKRKVVRGIGEGVYEGSKSLAIGLGEGITDFFVKPIKGAQQDGIIGFGKGFVQGSVSIISKPIAGTMDLIYQTGAGGYASTKAVSNYMKGKSNETKIDDQVRYSVPLEIQERILKEYDELLLYAKKSSK